MSILVVRHIAEKIAIIGAGKIGQAIIRALSTSNKFSIIATARRKETLRNLSSLGVITSLDNNYAVKNSEIIIISVKPYHVERVFSEVKKEHWKNKVIISIVAGISTSIIRAFTNNPEVYRAMPNINVLVKKSSTAIAYNGSPGENKELVEKIFSLMGKVYWVREELLDAWTGLIGSGPAYLAEIIDGMILGAFSIGLPRDIAFQAILDVMEGTAELLRNRRVHPAQMRDEVTTPGGTTIRGLAVLESNGVKAALIKAVEEATERSIEVNENIRKKIGLNNSS